MIFLKISLLNLRKHPRRTAMIIAAIALAVGAMELVAGMVDGMRENFFTNMLEESGHMQILPKGKDESLDPYSINYTIDNYKDILSAVQSHDYVTEASPFLQFGTLLISKGKNIPIAGNGIIAGSSFNDSVSSHMLEGSFDGIKDGILISKQIAELMNLKFGDPVILLVEDSEESPYYLEFPVKGIFQTESSDFDNGNVFISLKNAQDLLYLPDSVTMIKIKLKDKEYAETAQTILSSELHNDSIEIKTWRQIHGNFMMLIDLFDIFVIFMNFFTVIVAAAVITNSILMNMFERVREFGTMRAVGLKKAGLLRLITTEGLSVGVIGSIVGMAIGIPVVLYFQKYGLDYGQISETFGMGSKFYFYLTAKYVIINFISGILIAVFGSVYAAFVITKQQVIDNLTWR